jgi:flagellar hook-length control protein FliK
MINESVKNNTSYGSFFGIAPVDTCLPEGWEARKAEVKAKAAKLMAAANPGCNSPEAFAEKLRMVMEIGGERLAKMAENFRNEGSNVNTDNVNSTENANAEDDFINHINAAFDSLSEQELPGFFIELNAISQIFAAEEGQTRLAGMLAPEDRNQFANTMMDNAFRRISDMLGLALDGDVLGKPFDVRFDAEDTEHLATIIWYLDQTIGLVGERLDAGKLAVDSGENTSAAYDDPAELSGILSGLRKEKFNLEMAFRIVGAHEMISAMAAERSDKGAPMGIPQASDPANLGMTTSDTVRAFASLIKEELTSAMDRVRAITGGHAEMTDIEKAAVRLGAIKSEILNGALEGNNAQNRAAFEKAAAELKAAMMKNAGENAGAEASAVNVKTENIKAENVKTDGAAAAAKAAADNLDLPVSVAESTNKKAAKNVEDANKKASASVAVTAKSASGSDTDLPLSVKESANKETDGVKLTDTAERAQLRKIGDSPAARFGETQDVKISSGAAVNPLTGEALKNHKVSAEVPAQSNPAVGADSAAAKDVPAAQSGENAGASSASTSSAAAQQNSVMAAAAGTAETSAETFAADNSDSDSTTGLEGINSRANAALEQAEKARTAMARVDQEAIIRQLTDKLQHAIRNGAHELRVTLRPEVLGEVRMSIRVHGDMVMARMQVENRQVKAIVESNLQSLKDALEKQNLHVGAFSVDVGTENDRSPRQTWREMAEEAGISPRMFRDGINGEGAEENDNNDPLNGELGSDTGRRFGNNTFEYFI